MVGTARPIPAAALDDRLGFVGTAGSGKTYNASACVERLLDTGARVVVVDPLDVWWGLRLIADGSAPSRYSMPIFGGAHGDLPLNEHAGALIGETVATMAESCIVSLGSLSTKAAERRFMLAFLDAIYRKANGEPVHLIFDEADLWAPQKSSDPMLQSRMEEICRRGRVKGLIPWLITQRPAVISKDVLSQVDGLIAFKLTSSQDRDALEGWIEGQADRQQWKEIRAELPTQQQGNGVVWLPGRGVLTTSAFPPKRTFDSSRTPKRGEKNRATVLKPLDLGALKEKLATVEAETKANDPSALKAKITKLERELAQRGAGAAQAAPDPQAIAAAEQRGYARGEEEIAPVWLRRGVEAAAYSITELVKGFNATDVVHSELKHWQTVGALPVKSSLLERGPSPAPASTSRAVVTRGIEGMRAPVVNGTGPAGDLTGPQQRMLDVIAFWNSVGYHAPTREQVAAVCGYSIKASTFRVVAGALKTGGYIEYRDSGKLMLTPKGHAVARPLDAEESKRKLESVLSGAQIKVVGILRDAGGRLTRSDLISRAGYSEAASTHRVVIGGLKTLEVVDYPERGVVELSRWALEVLAA